ncbi:uncharacterized protein LOC116232768 [Phasianus colchicus]|uniref:uncharacterized protein LOC116232768 n=1 Tax=Phasianus colchicus TaxID=9054 RepID=UPI00129D36BE|nr:uncharacterized protein LOC116232768 [Phasianus colchicus]
MAAAGKRRGDAAGYLRPPAAAAIEGEPMSRRQEPRRGGPAPSRRPPPPAPPPPPTWPRFSRQPPRCHRPRNRRHSQQRPREREGINKRGTLLREWLPRYRKRPGRCSAAILSAGKLPRSLWVGHLGRGVRRLAGRIDNSPVHRHRREELHTEKEQPSYYSCVQSWLSLLHTDDGT